MMNETQKNCFAGDPPSLPGELKSLCHPSVSGSSYFQVIPSDQEDEHKRRTHEGIWVSFVQIVPLGPGTRHD